MPMIRILFLSLIALLLSQASADASTEAWARLLIIGKRNHSDPTKCLEAMRIAEEFGEHDARLHIATISAACSLRSKNPALAESLFKRAIADLETIDSDFPEIPCYCFELAKLYTSQGRYAESEDQLRRAIAIRDRWRDLSSNNPFNAELCVLLYVDYCCQGDTRAAGDAYDRMINFVQQLRSSKRRTECLGMIRYTLFTYSQNQKDLSQAQIKRLNEIALSFASEEASSLRGTGSYHYLANQLYQTAAIYRALGDTKNSERLARQSLELVKTELNPEKELDVLRLDVLLLSEIACSQRRFKMAKDFQAWFLSVEAQTYGQRSEIYAKQLRDWAAFWKSAGHPEYAKSWKLVEGIHEKRH